MHGHRSFRTRAEQVRRLRIHHHARRVDRGPVEHVPKALDLRCQVARMVADEEAAIVGGVGVHDLATVSWSKYLMTSWRRKQPPVMMR